MMEAVALRSEVVTLTKNVSVWERKLKIAEVSFQKLFIDNSCYTLYFFMSKNITFIIQTCVNET